MKKRLLCGLLTFAMVLSMLIVVPATTVVAAGTYKASDNPVLITTAADLKALRDDVNNQVSDFSGKTIKLMADIDISDADWTPIGNSSSKPAFKGNFDGQWHTITGLTQTRSSYAYSGDIGLFGYVQAPDSGSITFKNVYLKGCATNSYNIRANKGAGNVGAFISDIIPNTNATTVNISGIWSSIRLDISAISTSGVGGIVGMVANSNGPITVNVDSCWFSGYLNSTSAGMARYGGIVGWIQNTSNNSRVLNVSNCLVTNDDSSNGTIKVNASGADDIGGIVGFFRNKATGSIKNCIFAGKMNNAAGSSHVGYVVGEIYPAGDTLPAKVDMSNTYYVASYLGTAPHGYCGYDNDSYISNAPTSKTLDQIKAMTSGFSDNNKWYFRSDSELPVPLLLAPYLESDAVTSFSTTGTTHSISTSADMAAFAASVFDGNTYAGHTVNLLANVTLNISNGDASHPFSGNFNGQGHTVTLNQSYYGTQKDIGGLFSMVAIPNGGTITIQNVKVAGTMSIKPSSGDSADTHGCLISCTKSGATSGGACTLNILNCWSDVSLTISSARVGTVGGFIGWVGHQDGYLPNTTVNFDSCLWTGYLNAGAATADWGGYIGNTGLNKSGRTMTINLKNCVSAGRIALNVNSSDNTALVIGNQKCNYSTGVTTVNVENMICSARMTSSVTLKSGNWFAYFNRQTASYGVINLKNFYYFSHGAGGFNPIPLTPASGGGITSGSATSKTNAEILALTASDFSERGKWANTASYFVGSNNGNATTVIPAGIYGVFYGGYSKFYDNTAPTYDISTTAEMMSFAKAVNEGCVYFTGKTVRLTSDNVDVSGQTWKSIGNRMDNGNGYCFRGTFDGQGHCLVGMKSTQSVNNTGAFFGYLGDGAIVKNVWFKAAASGNNVTISGGSDTWRYFSSLLANACYGTVQITNVRNSMTLGSSYNSSTVGSFVGFMDNTVATTLTISGCVFDGRLDFGNYTNDIGGFVGSTGNNNGYNKTLTIENCLYAGTIGLNSKTSYSSIAGYLGHATHPDDVYGATSVTIRNCVSTGQITFLNTQNWDAANLGSCGQVIGTVTNPNKGSVSYTISNVYYNPSYLHMTANTASTKRFLGEIGNDKGTYTKDIDGAHFCTPVDLGALTASNLNSNWTFTENTSSTLYAPVPTYAKTKLSMSAPSYSSQAAQVNATSKSTSAYSGSITFTVDFTAGVSNFGTKNVNCGVILISNTKFKALASSGAITYATLTASGCGTRVAGLKGTTADGVSTMKVVLSRFTSNSTKQSEEYFAIPYIGSEIYLNGARLIAYSAL